MVEVPILGEVSGSGQNGVDGVRGGGASVLSELPILSGTTRGHPAAASGICRADPAAGGTVLLVFLPKSSGLLSVCEKVS